MVRCGAACKYNATLQSMHKYKVAQSALMLHAYFIIFLSAYRVFQVALCLFRLSRSLFSFRAFVYLTHYIYF